MIIREYLWVYGTKRKDTTMLILTHAIINSRVSNSKTSYFHRSSQCERWSSSFESWHSTFRKVTLDFEFGIQIDYKRIFHLIICHVWTISMNYPYLPENQLSFLKDACRLVKNKKVCLVYELQYSKLNASEKRSNQWK